MLFGTALVRTTHPLGDETEAITDCPATTVIGVMNDALTHPVRRSAVDRMATRRSTVPSADDRKAARAAISVRDAFQYRIPVTVRFLFATNRFPTLTDVDACATTRPDGCVGNVAPTLEVALDPVGIAEAVALCVAIPRQLRAAATVIATIFMSITSSEQKTRLTDEEVTI